MVRSLHTPAYDAFRALLIDGRARAQLTQAQTAERLGRPQSFVSKYETGERRLDIVEFLQVCHVIGIDPLLAISDLANRVD